MAWLTPAPRVSGAAGRYVLPAVSVTEATLDATSFHPTTTALRLPGCSGAGSATGTLAWLVCGVAAATCTNAIGAATGATVYVAVTDWLVAGTVSTWVGAPPSDQDAKVASPPDVGWL